MMKMIIQPPLFRWGGLHCCVGDSKLSITRLRFQGGTSSIQKSISQTPQYCWLPPALEMGRLGGHICPTRTSRGSRRGAAACASESDQGSDGKCLSLSFANSSLQGLLSHRTQERQGAYSSFVSERNLDHQYCLLNHCPERGKSFEMLGWDPAVKRSGEHVLLS